MYKMVMSKFRSPSITTGRDLHTYTTQENGTNNDRPLTDLTLNSYRPVIAVALLLQSIGPELFKKLLKQIKNEENHNKSNYFWSG